MMTAGTISPGLPCLGEFPPFDSLCPAELQALLGQTRLQRFERGEIVLQANEIPNGMHIVLDGEIRCLLPSSSGSEKLLAILGAGEHFAGEAALLGRPALTMALAVRPTRLLHIPIRSIRDATARAPAFAAAMNQALAAASYEMLNHIQLCTQLSSTQRVAQYLSQLAPSGAEQAEIRLVADKQTIAAQLNLTPETFSRVLSRFVRDGLVRPQGRRGLMLDKVSELRRAAQD